MLKFIVMVIGVIGTLFLINSYAPQAWSAGFTIPVGHGVHIPWAVCIIGAFIVVASRLKAK